LPVHTPLRQSLLSLHMRPMGHAGQVPPQSTSDSEPFWMESMQLPAAQNPSIQLLLSQWSLAVQVDPGAHASQVPPQSTSASSPLRTSSSQAGCWQIPVVGSHTPLSHSAPVVQPPVSGMSGCVSADTSLLSASSSMSISVVEDPP